MKNVDIVIISDTKSEELKSVMTHTLKTLYNSESDINFYTYVVESSNADYSSLHKNIKMIKPNTPFGYHKYLNIGRKLGTSEYVCLCNNDLDFKKGWASAIIKEMEKDPELLSASPISAAPHINQFGIKLNSGIEHGYKVRRQIAGWCIFQQRKIYEVIGDLDERFIFWYCDNDYAMDLKTRGIKNALITNSHVDHLVSKTLSTKKGKERSILTKEQESVFLKKWNIKK
jgi:GT2 family glycosyltransferase